MAAFSYSLPYFYIQIEFMGFFKKALSKHSKSKQERQDEAELQSPMSIPEFNDPSAGNRGYETAKGTRKLQRRQTPVKEPIYPENSAEQPSPSFNQNEWRNLPEAKPQIQYSRANENDDHGFDDAASYHSTSSNPNQPDRMSSAASYKAPQATPAQYWQLATQGNGSHSMPRSRPPIDSYYSTVGEDNMFRDPVRSPSTQHHYHGEFDRQSGFSQFNSSMSVALSGNFETFSARQQQQQQQPNPKTTEELGDEYFQKAVSFHEQGDFVSATGYFKRAADKRNPLGMLFYGLSLRHGWGCQANEGLAFKYLQKAGEHVVPRVKDMDPAVAGMAKEELAMAIYELGQSYRHGWGVSRNKKTAAYYFEVAAELGDADAQAELATCYEKGDGVKRDMKRAAHYYRLAHKQGIELFGTSWIFKKKYNPE